MSRNALVTGGAGFIGSHLSERLLADGWEVFALDDLSTGSIENVAQLRERTDFHLVVDSVLSPSVVSELVHKFNVGAIEQVTILELAARVLASTGSSSELSFIPYEDVYGQGIEDMLHRMPSIEKIGAALSWRPTLGLDQILADVIAHARTAPIHVEQQWVTR